MASTGKKTLGRRKIEIKKIEKKTSLQVTFTKRRRGLFRKASELVVLCGAEVAILVQSPAQKLYAFAHPSVEALINRASLSPVAAGQIARRCDDARRKFEEAAKMLEMEKRRAAASGGGFWWEESFEGLELHELEELLKALEDLELNVSERMKASTALSSSSLPDFCNSQPIQDFCNSQPIQDDFCNSQPIQDDFCNFQPIQDFCNSQPIQDFSDFQPIQDFCNFEPIQDFSNFEPIQELGDESAVNESLCYDDGEWLWS